MYLQVKPLLQVTNTEESLNRKEQELRQVVDHFDKLKSEHQELEQVHRQLAEEKTVLVQQLQAEQELCAEAEEVGVAHVLINCSIPQFVTFAWCLLQ